MRINATFLDAFVSKPPHDKDQTQDYPTIAGGPRVVANLRHAAKPFLLQQIAGPGAPRDHRLELDEVVIGRSVQAHISIESGLLSRKHVQLRRSGPEFVCRDLDSSNGFYLNGVRAHSAVLREGDTIQIGDVIFVFREGS